MAKRKKKSKKHRVTKKASKLVRIGWREWVALPDLGLNKVKAKIDTGARTSALHATDVSYSESRGKTRVRFKVSPSQDTSRGQKWASAILSGTKVVKSSIGIATKRPTITTRLKIGDKSFTIKLTLINRDVMGFRMLLGREALKNRFLVHSGKSFLADKKKKRVKK